MITIYFPYNVNFIYKTPKKTATADIKCGTYNIHITYNKYNQCLMLKQRPRSINVIILFIVIILSKIISEF